MARNSVIFRLPWFRPAVVLVWLIFIHTIPRGSSLDTDHCPAGCTCPELYVVNCTGGIPDFENKQAIHKLIVVKNTITEIKEGDFANFTALKHLILDGGMIQTLGPGAFRELTDTVEFIDLSLNQIKEIPTNTFSAFPNLNKLQFKRNEVKVLNASTFVNLSNLATLELELNFLNTIEEGAFSNVPKLKVINLFKNRFTEIPAVGLKNLKGLTELDMSMNMIHNLREDLAASLDSLETLNLESNPIDTIKVFPYIGPKLKTLDLQFTGIGTIDEHTWKHMSKLEVLHLSGNTFNALHQAMLRGLSSLKTLYVLDCSHLRHLGPDVFTETTNLQTIHIARNKYLVKIDDNAFRSSNASVVYINNNALTTFQEGLLPWSKLHSTYLVENQLVCDCHMRWVHTPGIFENNSAVKRSFSEVKCTYPTNLFNKTLMTVDPSDMICSKAHKEDNNIRVRNGVIGSAVAVMIVFSIIVMVKYRRRIWASCRRYYQYKRYRNDMIFTVENDHDTSVAELDDTEGRPLKEMRSISDPNYQVQAPMKDACPELLQMTS